MAAVYVVRAAAFSIGRARAAPSRLLRYRRLGMWLPRCGTGVVPEALAGMLSRVQAPE
jgi:hypothetical protein